MSLLEKLAFDDSLKNEPKSVYVKYIDETVFHISPDGSTADRIQVDAENPASRYKGACKVVYYLTTDEDGKRLYKGQKALQSLYDSNQQDRIMAVAAAIRGNEDESDSFGSKVESAEKNSRTATEGGTTS